MRSGLSYANVMATVAVFLALGGGALAATSFVGSDGKVRGCVSKKGQLTVLKRGKTKCAKGLTAITWNQQGRPGADGTNGTNGTNGATNLIVRTASANGSGALDASCNPGERAVGGGIGRTDGSVNINDKVGGSFPSVDAGVPASNGSTANGWRGVWEGPVANVTTWVICASP
jgi:hypothetical protein